MNPILRNSIAMGAFNLFGRGSGFLRYLILITLLSRADFALITYGFSIGRIARHFMGGGFDYLLAREGARNPDCILSYFKHSLVCIVTLGVAFFVAAFVYLYQVQQLSTTQMLVIFTSMIGSAFLAFSGITRSCFAAIERMEYILYTNVPARFLSISLLGIGLYLGMPVLGAAAAVALEGILWFVLLYWILSRTLTAPAPPLSLRTTGYLIRESWPLALYGFFNMLYLSLDVVMIQAIMEKWEDVALYTYASQMIEGFGILLGSYLAAAYPAFSRLHPTDAFAFRRLFRQSLSILMMITLPISLVLAIWAGDWLELLHIANPVTEQVLQLLSFNLLLSVINTLLIVVFMAGNRSHWLIGFTGLGVFLALTTNAVLIPVYGQVGAASATLITQVIVLMVMALSLARVFRIPVSWKRLLLVSLVSLFAMLPAWLMPWLPVWLVPVVVVPVWLTGLLQFHLIRRKDVTRLLGIMRPAYRRDV